MKNFKKSEVAVYAIALMLVAAGYFNYSTFEQKTEETYSEDVSQIDEQSANVGDAVLVSNNEVENTTGENSLESEETNATNTDETDYFASSKLDRDKMYAEMISNYENIINNTNASEAQKSIATQEITKINNTKNAIMICENLILTKGFENCVVLVNEENVNVVVSIKDGLNTESVAKIQNIIARELGTEIENIHITEK